jgi:hypothetical protein
MVVNWGVGLFLIQFERDAITRGAYKKELALGFKLPSHIMTSLNVLSSERDLVEIRLIQ